VLQCVAVCCRHTDTHAPIYSDQNWSSNSQFPTQCVCVCCSVLQCVADVPTHKLPCTALSNGVPILDVQLQVCCSVLQRVAVRCSALQCVAVCCSVLQAYRHTCCLVRCSITEFQFSISNSKCVAVCCSVLQCVAVCCSVLQCVADVPTHMLPCTVLNNGVPIFDFQLQVCCSVLQCVAARCSALQCVAVCCRRTDTHVALYGAQ